MQNPKIQIRCLNCQYRQIITDGTSGDFVEITSCNIPKRADGVSKDTFNRGKLFRCPQCGFATRASKLPEPELPKDNTNQPLFPTFTKEIPKEDDYMKQIDNLMKKREGGKIPKEKKS